MFLSSDGQEHFKVTQCQPSCLIFVPLNLYSGTEANFFNFPLHSQMHIPWQLGLEELGNSTASMLCRHTTQVTSLFTKFQVCFQVSALTRNPHHPSPIFIQLLELSFILIFILQVSLSLDFCVICSSVLQVREP